MHGSLAHLSISLAAPGLNTQCYTRRMFRVREQHKRIWPVSVLLISILLLGASSSTAQTSATSALDLDGHAVDVFHHSDGKVVVLLFIRTDCPISNRYAPTIQRLSNQFKMAEFFLVYPISTESPEQIRKHLQEYGYKLTALRDPDLRLVHAAGVRVTPESAVFSANGRLLYHGRIDDWYGDFGRARPAPTTHELASAIQAAIEGKPVPVAAALAVGCFLPDAP